MGWRRYEFPGRRLAIDFTDDEPAVARLVDLHAEVGIALTEQEWTHLVERSKYMRGLADRQEGRREWHGFTAGAAPSEPDWHRGCTGCWRTIWHVS